MALRTVQPRKPVTPRPAPGRTASPTTGVHKPPVLSALTNLATLSGGSPPGTGQQDANTPAWESDPVLQQIKAAQAANIAAADAQALAARQKALINFGYSADLGSLYGDPNTAGAAQANPFSILAQLDKTHKLRQQGLNESLNKANLFYSSTRADQLGKEGQQFLGEQYGAAQQLQGALGGYADAQAAAHRDAQGAIGQGETDAYTRWLNQQLQYGLGKTSKPRTVTKATNTPKRPK